MERAATRLNQTPVLRDVIPTVNGVNIAECIKRIEMNSTDLDIPSDIIVSNASDDRTREIARNKVITYGDVDMAYTEAAILGQPFGNHSLIAGSLLTLVGFQAGCFGLMAGSISNSIRWPDHGITNWIYEHCSLERGATLGIGLLLLGTAMARYLVWQWWAGGVTELPLVSANIATSTLIVLVIQTVFRSASASIVANSCAPITTSNPPFCNGRVPALRWCPSRTVSLGLLKGWGSDLHRKPGEDRVRHRPRSA